MLTQVNEAERKEAAQKLYETYLNAKRPPKVAGLINELRIADAQRGYGNKDDRISCRLTKETRLKLGNIAANQAMSKSDLLSKIISWFTTLYENYNNYDNQTEKLKKEWLQMFCEYSEENQTKLLNIMMDKDTVVADILLGRNKSNGDDKHFISLLNFVSKSINIRDNSEKPITLDDAMGILHNEGYTYENFMEEPKGGDK